MNDTKSKSPPAGHSGPLSWRVIDGRSLRFCGMSRTWDDSGRDEFSAWNSATGEQYYGEFIKVFSPDEKTYSIKVLSFGYGSKSNVGNPSPGARAAFSHSEADEYTKLIAGLFSSPGAKPPPLSQNKAPFDGAVHFADGWIRLR